ncbi:MAG: WD40 repeat domain-containing protein, partial [Planctomycetales bacterium]|nr:WD40 repeat domain-containing protein [Planctomycetales bacterium]
GPVECVAVCPDGNRVITVCDKTSVRLHELNSGQELRRFPRTPSPILDVAFLDDASSLMLADVKQNVRIWPLDPRESERQPTAIQAIRRWHCSDSQLKGLVAYPIADDDLVVLSNQEAIEFWRVSTGERVQSVGPTDPGARDPHFTSDGKYLSVYNFNVDRGTVVDLWDWRESRLVHEWKKAANASIHPRLPYFAVTSYDGKFRVGSTTDWQLMDPPTAAVNVEIGVHAELALTFANHLPRLAATYLARGSVHVYDMDGLTPKLRFEIPTHPSSAEFPVFSPDDNYLVQTSLGDNSFDVYDAHTGRKLRSVPKVTRSVLGLNFSPDGKRLLAVGDDNRFRLWNTENWQLCYESPYANSPDDHVAWACFTADGESIVTVGATGMMTVHRAASQKTFDAGIKVLTTILQD